MRHEKRVQLLEKKSSRFRPAAAAAAAVIAFGLTATFVWWSTRAFVRDQLKFVNHFMSCRCRAPRGCREYCARDTLGTFRRELNSERDLHARTPEMESKVFARRWF